jgi:hypothetical protein
LLHIDLEVSNENNNIDENTKAKRVVKYNEKDNVPIQTEEEEAEVHENAQVERLADEIRIMGKKTQQ